MAAFDPLTPLAPSGIFAVMPLLEALAAAALVSGLLYIVDRAVAFHVCLYAAITSGKRFTAEEAYRAIVNPFTRAPRVALWAGITGMSFILALNWGIGDGWAAVVAVFASGLTFVAISGTYALKAFRRTEYGVAFAEAIKEGRWRDS